MQELRLSSKAISERTFLDKLIQRLNFSFRSSYLEFIASARNIEESRLYDQGYQYETGLDIGIVVDEQNTLNKIEEFIQSATALDLNAGNGRYDWYTPLCHAVRTQNLSVVRLLVKLGAADVLIMRKEAIESPDIYAYFLQAYPQAYQNSVEFQGCIHVIEQMKIECRGQDERLKLMDQCKELIECKRIEYLRVTNCNDQQDALVMQLPEEMILPVLRCLSTTDLLVAGQVCKSWHLSASSSILWNYTVLPQFRGDNAKYCYLRHPEARVTQQYFFQLIKRLDRDHAAYCKENADLYYSREIFKNETGLNLEDETHETAILQEILNIVRYSRCIDVNKALPSCDWYTPLHAAVRSNNLQVVQLLVENGANNLQVIPHECIEKPAIFAYALDVCPELFRVEELFDELCDTILKMKVECAHYPDRTAIMDQCENILRDRRADYLLDAMVATGSGLN